MALFDELTDKDLRDLAALVGPYLKESSIHVENVPSAETLEGIRTLPGVQFLNGVKRTVAVPVSSLKGRDGEKGDSLDFTVLGSFNTLEELTAAYPQGSDTHGLFKVGDTAYIWAGDKYEPLNLDVFRSFSLEQFETVVFTGNDIIVDFSRMPYAKATLSGDATIFNLKINNTKDGSAGKILVFQTGFKQISLGDGIKGTVDLPLNGDTIALLTYNRLGDTIYIHSNTVLGDVQFPTPQRIIDFLLIYSDSNTCSVQWTAPWANNIYDKPTEYDMRYSNNLVDANDPKVWAGLKKVESLPVPASPGELQQMTISGLVPNKEYYIYVKSVKVNFGVSYASSASDPLYFKTIGAEDTSKAYRIGLSGANLYPYLTDYGSDPTSGVTSIDKIVDEQSNNVYLDNGYPDTKNQNYTTYWSQYAYGRDSSPFQIIIDLFTPYVLDKLFVYSRARTDFNVYCMRDQGYPWVKLDDIKVSYNSWDTADLGQYQARFIKLGFDRMDFGSVSTNPVMPEGSEGFPDPEYNGTMGRIDNIILYGRPASTRPEGIKSPLRKSTSRKTVDEFFCTNGHAYQQGRLHSLCSGSHARLYINATQFATNRDTSVEYATLADFRFDMDQIPWVISNNGTGEGLADTLRNTYKRYGLRPYLCFQGSFIYCQYDKSNYKVGRPADCYWYPDAWRAVPSRGVGGLDKYFSVTEDPLSYKTYAKLAHAVAAKYGNVPGMDATLFNPGDTDNVTGLDLISGVEFQNEPDGNWDGWAGYSHAEEYSALVSAASDGHGGAITDEKGLLLKGAKGGGVLAVSSGTAGVNVGYMLPCILKWKMDRRMSDIPADALSQHMYFSNIGNQGASSAAVQYGITLEESLTNKTGSQLVLMAELRNRLAPSSELWLTEFGWGESGGRDTRSKYQCYTQAGRYVGDWLIPDRHRSDVKGAWTVRACIQLMRIGWDQVNYYSTECESNYFGAGNWDQGAGFEMFHWNDCKETAPGAKAAAIKAFEHSYARGGFATTGLFGRFLENGCYPVTRAYWWTATMRNRLKGYVFTGMKYVATDSRIVVACFRKQNEEKGAYVVYLNDSQNTGVAGVGIPVPDGVAYVRHVTTYIPDIANPQSVDIGYDHARTGLAGARHERYANGEWVLQHTPYYRDKYYSMAQGEADYPSDPEEGDEVVVLPTPEENPYYPIVGPVHARNSLHGLNPTAGEFEKDREDWESEPGYNEDGTVNWRIGSDIRLSWRQVEAVCDYIEYHPEGIHGRNGDEVTESTVRGMILTNVSEFPEYYFFDAVPEPDFKSSVENVNAVPVSSSTVDLWWNNTNTEDTGYEIFMSDMPEAGYTLLKSVPLDVENKAVISGLSPNTAYYFKVRPVMGGQKGEMSGYTSARTYSELAKPDNLRLVSRSATGIEIAWDYPSEQADFVMFSVYRADDAGTFAQIATVDDISVKTYSDSGLGVGKNYAYKVRAVGNNGLSDYSDELSTRTMLAEECSPVLKSAMTDKLGTKIILTFDLDMGAVAAESKIHFTLTEDGSERLITGVSRSESNPNRLQLAVADGSLSDYTRRTDIRISFDGTGVDSAYGVALDAFANVKVGNVIGNFTNIEATFKINFCGPNEEEMPVGEEWNNMQGDPSKGNLSLALKDIYGRETSTVISTVHDDDKYKWNGYSNGFSCGIEGIEKAVYYTGFRGPSYGALSNENRVARIQLGGLNDEHRYTVKIFGANVLGGARLSRFKVGETYSNTVDQHGNTTTYMEMEDIKPSGGIVSLDIIHMTDDPKDMNYPIQAFMEIEEFKSSSEGESTDVYLREISVNEAVEGAVKFPDITLHLNYVGTATHYRVSETDDLTAAVWHAIGDSSDVPYDLSSGFGSKTLYVQVKNLYSESNVRSLTFEYRDPYVPLVLRNIYINNDDARTYDRNVTLLADKEGIPTHYKAAESADLSSLGWTVWPDEKLSTVPYVLSDGSGQKTVYLQLKDNLSETAVRVDTIEAVLDLLSAIIINGGASYTYGNAITVAFTASDSFAPTHYMLSESASFSGAIWQEFVNPASFILSSGFGNKTLYAKLRDVDRVSEVVMSAIEYREKQVSRVALRCGMQPSTASEMNVLIDAGGLMVNNVKPMNNYEIPLYDVNGEVSEISYYNDTSIAGQMGSINASYNPTEPEVYDGVYSFAALDVARYFEQYNQPETIVPYRIIFKAPAGTYKVRVLGSTSSAYGTTTGNKWYECNGVKGQPDFSLQNNFTNFVELDNVQPNGAGYLIVKWWGDPTRAAFACANLIEIIKK